jgi:phosphopantothenoylcysteine decarboxylase/phosphopantothenate--cysteine ligase
MQTEEVPFRPTGDGQRLLLTAGPTHEPIDAVRYIGNRSSGRLGVSLADSAADRGWSVTLLLGPTALTPSDSRVRVLRFRTTTDLDTLLQQELPEHDVLVMAAAVADYRPRIAAGDLDRKHRRTDAGMTIQLEPTPDLLAGCSKIRRPDQLLVGFALEPRDELLASARAKLTRKGLDLIVANPLETMDAPTIEAVVLDSNGKEYPTAGPGPNAAVAPRLLDGIAGDLPPPPPPHPHF